MSIPGSVSPLFLGAAGQATGGDAYEVSRSVRFNSADTAYLSRTPGTAGNRKTWTWAGWVKRSKLGATQALFHCRGTVGNNTTDTGIGFTETDELRLVTGAVNAFISAAVFRDVSAWYHIVYAFDTTQAADSDRIKIYVNGTQITSASASYPSQNSDWFINSTSEHSIGRHGAIVHYLSGYLADIHFIDGQALTPTSFGEFDDNGVWQPIDASGLTYGTNGFHLPFSDNSTAAALGTDTSGNGNTWTVNNLSVANQGYVGAIDASNSFAGAFDGNETGTWAQSFYSTSYTEMKFIFDTPISWSSTIRVKALNYSGGGMKINGTDVTSAITSNGTNNWNSLTSLLGSSGSISSITVYQQNTNYLRLFAVELDGTVVTGVSGTTTLYGINNDSLVDSPTNGSQEDTGVGNEVVGNYATLNPLDKDSSNTLNNGNLDLSRSTSSWGSVRGTIGMSSGKWYFEYTCSNSTTAANTGQQIIGIGLASASLSSYTGSDANGWGYSSYDGKKYNNQSGGTGSGTAYGSAWTNGDVVGVAFDADNGTLTFYKNGTSQGTAYSSMSLGTYFPMIGVYGGSTTASGNFNYGSRPFAYTAPSGFKALCTANLPTPTIADGSTAMDVALYTGNASTNTISGLSFSPDLVWCKSRGDSQSHALFDQVRGSGIRLQSNANSAEDTYTTYFTGFTSDGFTLANNSGINQNGDSLVAWTWDAGSSTVSNTQGSITSQVRANASAGFSVVTYTGNGSGGATFGHGLGVAPKLVIFKCRTVGYDWLTYHGSLPNTTMMALNTTGAPHASGRADFLNSTDPSSTVVTLGSTVGVNDSQPFVAYCFAPVAGYSSFGSYSAASAQQGPFVYTGFRPRFIMIKRADSGSYSDYYSWVMIDTARNTYNTLSNDIASLYANRAYQEGLRGQGSAGSPGNMQILSNGFVPGYIGSYSVELNESGTYIYCAWAEAPFQYARAR